MKIGFIGLGHMGQGVAGNLLKAGHDVTVWNRSPGPVEKLTAQGALKAATPSEAMAGDVLFSLLASDAAMREIGLADALLEKAAPGLVHINMATISPAFAGELTKAHAAHGLDYVAAPVFGRPDAAARGELVIAAAGAADALARVQPLLDVVGRRTVIVGADPAQANLFKIAGNFMIASAMETLGEAFALLRKGGIDPALFHEVLTEKLFAGVVFQNYGKMILADTYEPAGFKLKLGLKDVNLVRDAAAALGAPMPLAELVRDHYDAAMALGWEDKDWSALGGIIARDAGL